MKIRASIVGAGVAAQLCAVVVASASLNACQSAEVVDGFPDSFVGVGVELKVVEDYPIVVRTLRGGSAEAAGVQRGDQIRAIDQQSTEGLSLGDVVMRLRGRPNSQVTLQVDRKGTTVYVVVQRQRMTKGKGKKDYRADRM